MANFSMLPAEIMLDIFYRLPTESVLECKSVSKTWNTVMQHPSLSQLHFNHLNNLDSADSGKHGFIFLLDDESIGAVSRQFYYVEYDENSSETPSSHRIMKMNLNPPFECYRFVSSSNGLICLSGLPAHYTFADSDQASYVAYICNPITRESLILPELKRRSTRDDAVIFFLIGFGYVGLTNEYKVVRLYKFMREPEVARIEVYTLGSGKGWRNVGKKIYVASIPWQHGVFANGCIYWNFGKGKIVAFDLATEMFVELAECSEFYNRSIRLGVLGDCLSATHCTDIKSSEVWLLKKKKDESLMSWSKEFSLTNMDGYDIPLALTGSSTVLCRSRTKLHIYDLKSSSSEVVVNFGRFSYQAIPHKNTLLSLMALGDNTKNTGNW